MPAVQELPAPAWQGGWRIRDVQEMLVARWKLFREGKITGFSEIMRRLILEAGKGIAYHLYEGKSVSPPRGKSVILLLFLRQKAYLYRHTSSCLGIY